MVDKLKNSFAVFAVALAVLFVGVQFASAALTQTQKEALMALGFTSSQIAALEGLSMGGGSSCSGSYVHTMTLKVGSKGSQVAAMQSVVGATADGNFGPMTKSKVMAFQSSKGLVADGVVGPATGAAIANASANCGNTGNNGNTGSTGSNTLNGGAGDITVDLSGEYSNEDVGEGEEDVPVLAFDIEADDDSDVMINSIKVEFAQDSSADSDKLDDYADEITVWFDGDKVGSADADDFNESSDVYSKNISLDGVIIRAGDEERLTIAVSALNNLDSGDIDSDDWAVGVSQIRFTDGDGVVTTDTYSLDVQGALNTNDETGTLLKKFDFEDFAGAADVELRASLEDESINDARVLNVDDTDDTSHKILSFNLEARGDSDIWVDEIPVVITTTGETDEAVIVSEAVLWHKGSKIASESVPTGGAVTFDDLDLTIDAGDKEEFIVEVKLQDTNGALDDGDTVQATLTVSGIDAEDEAGDSLSGGDLTGSAVGDAHAAYEVGFYLKFVSATESVQTSDTATDVGTFTLKYEVEAFDGDIYIDNTCVEDNNGSEVSTATSYSVTNDGSNTTNCVMTAAGTVTNADSANTFKVLEGTKRVFTLTVSVSATADSFAQVSLEAIGWDNAAGGDDNVFDFNLPGDFKSDPVFLNFTA